MEDFLGQTLPVFSPGCNHTQTLYCLPTCLGKMPDDCSIHACSWFSGKPSKIHPYWTKPRNSYWSWKRKNPQINTKYQCYLHKNYLILIPPQHSTSHGCLWEKKANMEHWYFCEMHALIPLPHSNGNLWIVATIFLFHISILKKNQTKPTFISNKNNPKQFLQFWNIQKDTSPHCVYKKKGAKQI